VTPLRIALVAPPWFTVPPVGYGGIELVVYLLARELKARGHDVTVFAAHGSDGGLGVVPLADEDWSRDLGTPNQRVREATYLRRVYDRLKAEQFDLIHEHNEYPGMMVAHTLDLPVPVVATIHGAVGGREATFLREVDAEIGLVAISESQAAAAQNLRWDAIVHNSVDLSALDFSAEKDDYVVQLARINPDKGQVSAIEASRAAGLPLILAGKLDSDPRSRAYFETEIEPELGDDVRWIENVAGDEKRTLLARAKAMLFPLQWDEPFGLAMVEAMASGTPVIAFPRGAARELIQPNVTGFLAESASEMAALLDRVSEIDPYACRQSVADRFSPERMTDAYEAAYEIIAERYRDGHVPGHSLRIHMYEES
jgi:glycosyltransferase involved in cell wall biosynthesis